MSINRIITYGFALEGFALSSHVLQHILSKINVKVRYLKRVYACTIYICELMTEILLDISIYTISITTKLFFISLTM